MAKYVSKPKFAAAPIMTRGCGDLEDGAYANDTIGKGCWAIVGTKIIIEDTSRSYMGGFEEINAMFKVDATQNPLPCCANLNAPVA